MNAFTIKLRSLGRQTGLIRFLKFILPKKDYEENFSNELLTALMPGDIVWDIGANVGYYTTQFAQAVKEGGKVYAFEPAPGCLSKLRESLQALPPDSAEVEVVNAAVSDKPGKLNFSLEENPAGVTHHLIPNSEESNSDCIEVQVVSGDFYACPDNFPNVIKIDVEGYEEEVIIGMEKLLTNPTLRAIFCEVHFSQLEKRGKAEAPIRIESLLKLAGFSVSWPSHSHIAALRK